jgi:Leucine-rich repeat (LRR) protein
MNSPERQSTSGKRPRPEKPSAASSSHAACELQRPQPSAEAESPLQPTVRPGSRERRIPADVVQNTAEFLGRVARLLSFRGVSTEWQGAVSDAVGFLNGRCWNRFELGGFEGPLWTSLRVDDAIVVVRCAVLCLRSRLETVDWLGCSIGFRLPLQLLGKNNTTLTALNLDSAKFAGTAQVVELRGLKRLRLRIPNLEVSLVPLIGTLQTLEVLDLTLHPVTDLQGLQGLVALRELTLSSTPVTNESFAGLEQLLARLHKLDLSECHKLKAISNLAPATSLRELDLSYSGINRLEGLQKLVALETLTIKHSTNAIKDWSILRQCHQLVALTLEVNDAAYSTKGIQAMVDSAAHCLVRWRLCRGAPWVVPGESRALLPSFLRCTVLQELDLCDAALDNASIRYLPELRALEVLQLSNNPVDDVSALAGCRALRELSLTSSKVTDEGIAGLEHIVTLQKLDLIGCPHVTSVSNLRHCAALRELKLNHTPISNAGIEGLERVATLTKLHLFQCEFVTDISALRHSPSLRELNISYTDLTGAGIAGLEEIGTLEHLDAVCCPRLDDVTSLRRCRTLRILNLGGSNVTDASMAALACVATLESLSLAGCKEIRDVSALSESVSLRELNLSFTNVDNAGITGLERIPTLTSLQLEACEAVTDVRNLVLSKSLRRLNLSSSGVTDAGIAGIETAPALEDLDFQRCPAIDDCAAVARRAAEHAVKVPFATKGRDDDTETEPMEETARNSSGSSSSRPSSWTSCLVA